MNGVEEEKKNKTDQTPQHKKTNHIKEDVGMRRGSREWRRLEDKKNGEEPE